MKREHALADPAAPRGQAPTPGGTLHLHSIVLLAGGVGPNGLAGRLGRSVLNLPVDARHQLKDVWAGRVRDFVLEAGSSNSQLGLVVLTGEATPTPSWSPQELGRPLRVLRDESRFRGTAGALRDLLATLRPDDHVLLGTASQCPEPGYLRRLTREADPSAAIVVSVDSAMAPSGLLLLRGDALSSVPPIGFHDLKEQVLPRLASTHRVQVVKHTTQASAPLRDLAAYVQAIRSWHVASTLTSAALSPLQEKWRSSFSIIEPGAEVHASARLHDAVVLAGGRVEANARLARSIVAPGGVVRRGTKVVDQIVGGAVLRAGDPQGTSPGEAP